MLNRAKQPAEMTKEAFIASFGKVYEDAPWVAEAAWAARNGTDLNRCEDLIALMAARVDDAPHDQKLALICAHPDLAVDEDRRPQLSAASQKEQSNAGFSRYTDKERDEICELNKDYKTKFGFPFVMAVTGKDRAEILAAFRQRINNSGPQEFDTAIAEIHKIARFRLDELLSPQGAAHEA